jgi:ATP-binding cassette subfamily F protein uup
MKHARIGDLSGGERNRVLLARLLTAGGNLLVLDEPTNDLDLMTLRVLEEALVAFAGCVLVVSHDRWFLDRVATHVLFLDGAGGARVDTGDVSSVLARAAAARRQTAADDAGARRARRRPAGEPPSRAAAAAGVPPVSRRLSNWERTELDGLPDAIEAAERALAGHDARLADPALYADPAQARRAAELARARDQASAELERLLARWEELSTRDAAGG